MIEEDAMPEADLTIVDQTNNDVQRDDKSE